jgi:hypothetical protein
MARKKSLVKKRELLNRLIIKKEGRPKTFWQKEMTLLNRLIKEFGESEFWNVFSLDQKVDSIAVLTCDFYRDLIINRIKQYNFKLKDKPVEVQLDDSPLVEPKQVQKQQTVRDFLSR